MPSAEGCWEWKDGLLFDKASFLAFHKVRVPKGPSPRVPGAGLSCVPAALLGRR